MIYRLLKLIHRIYKLSLSVTFGGHCRFYPYCSDYCLESVKRFGIIKGGILTVIRLIKCNPWNKGGEDPVPDKFEIKYGTKKN